MDRRVAAMLALAVTLPGAASMSLQSQSACQGATFTVFLRAGT